MNLIDTFLWFTVISYYVFAIVPKKTIKGNQSKTFERISMLVSGTIIAAMLVLNVQILWIVGGALWIVAACLSYLGYVQWNILWKDKVSDEAQMVMFLWDALIALSCLVKL